MAEVKHFGMSNKPKIVLHLANRSCIVLQEEIVSILCRFVFTLPRIRLKPLKLSINSSLISHLKLWVAGHKVWCSTIINFTPNSRKVASN